MDSLALCSDRGEMKRIAPFVVVAALAASQPACYGTYSAVKALNRWNGQVTDSKVYNSLIHVGLYVIPVSGGDRGRLLHLQHDRVLQGRARIQVGLTRSRTALCPNA
jgi:hypothetical protein